MATKERKEAELRQQEEEARNYPVPRFLQVSNHLNKVNIAVTGASGTGKSHLNNVIRMVKRNDSAWAPVGVIETTQEPDLNRRGQLNTIISCMYMFYMFSCKDLQMVALGKRGYV